MKTKFIGIAAIATTFVLLSGTSAFAIENSWVCAGETGVNSYACVSEYGYRGEDGFDMDRFSEVSGGLKHSCTSFAAYMVYKLNPTLTAISTFDSAQYWDTQSVERAGATFGPVPHVGDIAQWDASTNRSMGHVAYVEEVKRTPNGSLSYIIVADDNSGLLRATKRKLYPGSTTGVISWPKGFITFYAETPNRWGTGKPPFELNSAPLNLG